MTSTDKQSDTSALQDVMVIPHLILAGRCEEALAFYEQALGANVLMKMRYNESPQPFPEGALQPGFEEKIMHATLQIGKMTLMASDGSNDQTKLEGFRLTLRIPTETACEQAFDALADGGNIELPLAPTFWASRYGQVTDRFGVGWTMMVADA